MTFMKKSQNRLLPANFENEEAARPFLMLSRFLLYGQWYVIFSALC